MKIDSALYFMAVMLMVLEAYISGTYLNNNCWLKYCVVVDYL